ncbi:MAG TPA: DMT family transporter [Leptolyngbyaceae cyanobacterium M65_K2018_010]|nr:DMT family transporter [Leptolyngbyaceae cyanobacterium M65_K2018_010]
MDHRQRSLLQVHTAVFLFGLAGLFGKLLDWPATVIVLGRTGLAALALGGWLGWRRVGLRPGLGQELVGLALLGMLLAFHWVSFFRSIQLSTVAIGLLTFSSFPVFVTLLEPLLFASGWRWQDGAIALTVVLGVALVVPSYRLGSAMTLGALWGLLSGLSFALLQLLNKGYRQRHSALTIAFYQNLFAFLSLALVSPWATVTPSLGDLGWLIILGVGCTALAHTLFIESLAVLRTQVASVISGLEPVYGIALAALVLGEMPTSRTLLGGLLIVGATTLASWEG